MFGCLSLMLKPPKNKAEKMINTALEIVVHIKTVQKYSPKPGCAVITVTSAVSKKEPH